MLACLLRRSMSQRLSVLLLVFGLAWCLLLLHYTVTQPRRQSSAELRQQILELSRRYIKALSEENHDPSRALGPSMSGYADLKRTIAVLLDDIMNRLVKLEGKVDAAVNASVHSHNSSHAVLTAAGVMQRPTKRDKPGSHPNTRSHRPQSLPRPRH